MLSVYTITEPIELILDIRRKRNRRHYVCEQGFNINMQVLRCFTPEVLHRVS